MTKGNRKIGLGVMGFADMLIALGVAYDSDEALPLADEVMSFIHDEARAASEDLARERGVFPNFEGSHLRHGRPAPRVRNATVTTIAPTGTISIIAGCSSGIEPLFAHLLRARQRARRRPHGRGATRTSSRSPASAASTATSSWSRSPRSAPCAALDGVPEDVQHVFATAHDITPEWHIRLQAAFQKHTDNAVSKTVNFPNEATVEDVEKVYLLAYEPAARASPSTATAAARSRCSTSARAKKKREPEAGRGHRHHAAVAPAAAHAARRSAWTPAAASSSSS